MSEYFASSFVKGNSLYINIKSKLIEDIKQGVVRPGDFLPNERELSKRFDVAIGTLRRAVEELVAEGVLVRQQGRGTSVRLQDRDQFMFQFFKIAARDGTREFPSVKTLEFAKIRAKSYEAKALGIQTGQTVFRVLNVLSISNKPVIFDKIFIPEFMFLGLSRKKFEDRSSTIYALYQNDFCVTVLGGVERVRAIDCEKKAADLLNIELGHSVLSIERVAYTFGQKPAEFRVSVVNTSHFDYVTSL